MAGCSDSATSWRLFDSNINMFYWVHPIGEKWSQLPKPRHFPRTRVRSDIAGASYFALFLIVIGFSAFAIYISYTRLLYLRMKRPQFSIKRIALNLPVGPMT